jgi:hypothetical protein
VSGRLCVTVMRLESVARRATVLQAHIRRRYSRLVTMYYHGHGFVVMTTVRQYISLRNRHVLGSLRAMHRNRTMMFSMACRLCRRYANDHQKYDSHQPSNQYPGHYQVTSLLYCLFKQPGLRCDLPQETIIISSEIAYGTVHKIEGVCASASVPSFNGDPSCNR